MQIAKVSDGAIEQIDDHRMFFPNTSFSGEPSAEFLAENSCLPASTWLAHNPDTHKLVNVLPYIDRDVVYTVEVQALSQEELDDKASTALASAKTQRAEAYRAESDPLFFKAQRGEATVDEWLAKVTEIKARY